MDKQKESCPWCQADVWLEPTRRHTYRCPFCSRNFNFVPSAVATAGGSAPQLAAAATPPGTAAAPTPSVLEEHILPLRGDTVPVHPAFRVIFTSNPADYAGVHGVQDALLDRMVTIRLDSLDQDTEVAIIRARSEAALAEAERIVDLVRAFRDAGLKTSVASVRPGILIARILKVRGGHAHASDPIFMQTCWDVLLSQARRAGLDPATAQQAEAALRGLIKQLCSAPLPGPRTRPRRSRGAG